MMGLMLRMSMILPVAGLAAHVGAASPSVPAPAPAQTSLAATGQLEPGMWQLDVKGRASRLACLADLMALMQVEHDQMACSRFVIANEPRSATVHYSCQRAGWGRTTLRVEAPRIVRIQTQGISRNAPFDYVVEARRIGGCNAQTASRPR